MVFLQKRFLKSNHQNIRNFRLATDCIKENLKLIEGLKEMENIIVNDIEIEVIRKKIKNIHLTVHPPEGQVRLSVPKWMDDKAIRDFIVSKIAWIKKHQNRMALQDKVMIQNFLSGESHLFLGDTYLLNVIETNEKQRVELRDAKFMDLYVKPGQTSAGREKVLIEWYRKELKKRIPVTIEKWEKIIGVNVNEWAVKRMKTKWGSCNIAAKRIWINLELAKKKPQYLDYIIVHELLHLLERYHNEHFKILMKQFLPDWKNIQSELNNSASERT